MNANAIARCAPWLWVFCAGCSMSSRVTAAAPPSAAASPVVATAPDAPSSPDVPPSERAASIADAISQLDDSEKALTRELARKASPPRGGAPKTERPDRNDSDKKSESPAEPCDTACTALRSMRRSSEYLCKLTGDVDARCTEARDRVRRARDRVTTSCGACPVDSPLSSIDRAPSMGALVADEPATRLAIAAPDVP